MNGGGWESEAGAKYEAGANGVLVPAPFGPHGLTCTRSLGRRGVRTVVAVEDENDPIRSSRYCDESVVVPSPHDDLLAYKDALVSLARRPDVRAVVPNREEDVYLLSKYGDEFADHVAPLWPSIDALQNVQDRVRLAEVAEEAGVSTVETWPLDDAASSADELFIKPRFPILIADYVSSYAPTECDPRSMTRYLPPGDEPDLDLIYDEMKHVPIVQEFVRGNRNEYAFFALYDRGEAVATFQHQQVRGETYAGGASVFRKSVDVPALEEAGLALFDHLDWHGVAEAEFLRDDQTGEFKLMEVNPRMWASLSCAVRAGADFPYYYWLAATGRSDDIDSTYEVGVGTHSLFGELKHLLDVVKGNQSHVERPSLTDAVRDVVVSCYDQPHFEYPRLSDPGPFVRGVLNTIPTAD